MKILILLVSGLIFSMATGLIYVGSQVPENNNGIANNCTNCLNTDQDCTISGRVVNEIGQPVYGAKVFSLLQDRPPRGRVLYGLTDYQGNFTLIHAECGNNSIFASKEEDGYSRYPWILSDNAVTDVTVQVGGQVPQIEVRIGPKSPRLKGIITDAKTGKSIGDARITIRRVDKPELYFSTSIGADGKFNLLTPLVPFTIKISSPKHKDWQYEQTDDPQKPPKAMKLKPDKVHQLKVSLVPIS